MDISMWSGATADEALQMGVGNYSVEHARRIVESFAAVTTTQDVRDFIEGFTEDCVVHLAPLPIVEGREALASVMSGIFSADRENFRCQKVLRSLNGDTFGVVWINCWTDRQSGKSMLSKGVEFWQMRVGRIARWDGAAAAWEA
jgi:ketosteroid isomerase-like protein